MTLRAVRGDLGGRATRVGGPVLLTSRARRPGLAHEEVHVPLDDLSRRVVQRAAARDALPPALWATFVVESARAIEVISGACGASAEVVPRALDKRAAERSPSPGEDRLTAWARALRGGASRPEALAEGRLCLLVPYHTTIAWRQHARSRGCSVAGWARGALLVAPARRHLWEAGAAERGQTLAEWVAQAAFDVIVRG